MTKTYMKKTRLVISACCLLLLAPSCKEHREEQQLLNAIEQTWQLCESSQPDAQARADGLRDSVSKSTEHVRQKYDLLSIRLRDKRYTIPTSPDSALQTLSYFEGRNDEVDKERAYYYLGSAYRDLKDYPRAVSLLLKTVDWARQCKNPDTLVWQNALSQLKYLYMLQLNYEDELGAALESVELARKSGKNMGFNLMDVATAYEHLKDTLLCLQYCDLSYQVIRGEQFPREYGNVLANMLATYSKYNHYEKVDTLLQQLMLLPEDLRPHNYELGLALYQESAGSPDSAILHYKTYYNRAKTISGRYEASAGLQRCYERKGDLGLAVEWGHRLYDTNDSIIHQRAFEETRRARDTYTYYRDREEEQAIMRRDERIIFISVTVCLALLSIALGLLLLYYYRKKRFMEEIIGKDRLLQERSKALKQSKKMNKKLMQMALMSNATVDAEGVVAQFRKVATGQAKLEEDSWKELMSAVETLYPGFLDAVQERMLGRIHEPLLRTICLQKIGLTPVQIAHVMEAKIQTVCSRIKRAEETCSDLITPASSTSVPS